MIKLAQSEKSIDQHLVPQGIRHIGQYLENGSRMYGDVGLFEYATPECPTLEDLVIHELAGEGLIWDAYGHGQTNAKTLHKRAVGPYGTNSTGTHENYSTAVDLWTNNEKPNDAVLALASHFATRTVFTGAGRPTNRDVVLGQKMSDIYELFGTGATSKKALVNTRNEPHAGGSSLRRLHVVCGDSNMSPWAIRMKFGTTSLVLRLIEHGVDLSDLFLEEPVKAARQVAGAPTGINRSLLMKSGKTMTPLNIQEEFANRAQKLSHEIDLPEDERAVISDWFAIINILRNYSKNKEYQVGMEQLDWYIKQERIKLQGSAMRNKGITNDLEINSQRRALDLRYDRLPDGTGVKLREAGKPFSPHMPTDEKIFRARTTPPEGRAKLRGAMIVELSSRKLRSGETVGITWEYHNSNGRAQNLGPIDGVYSDELIQARVRNL